MSEAHIQYHLGIKEGDVGRYVLLPGDPGRCKKIASYFDNPCLVAQNREFTTYTGTLLEERTSVTSTGIGCPSTAIAIEELIACGADTFIRVGTSGAMQPHIHTGDVAIVSGAIRDEGTSLHYAPIEFPAVADLDVLNAMREGARHIGMPHHVGIAHSKDSFYGQHAPDRMPIGEQLKQRWQSWIRCGTLCSEMEVSTIFILASIYRKRAGGVMFMYEMEDREPTTDIEKQDLATRSNVNRAIQTAIEGLKILIEMDKKNTLAGTL